MRTFQTRLVLSDEHEAVLDQYADLMSRVERSLFADLQKNTHSIAQLKVLYLVRFGITARQFNSCRSVVEGKIRSLIEIRKQRIEDLSLKVEKLCKKLKGKRLLKGRHKKFQRLQRLESKLQRLQLDREKGIVRLCFGTRKLFHAQHNLEENDFPSHEEWKRTWNASRACTFFLMGSKDETAGNQSCCGILDDQGALSLRLRLPDGVGTGKYLVLPELSFNYGHQVVLDALRECVLRKELASAKDPGFRERGTAVSYRFVKDEKGWRIFVSLKPPQPSFVTKPALGYIGIDLNVDHLAMVETDHYGNPVASERLDLCLYGKSSDQARALTGDAAKVLVDWAVSTGKPLVLERLDFKAKRRELDNTVPKHARMLSSFAYNRTLEAIKARAYRYGVQVFEVNPAYTSQIGKIKFAKRYGLSIHQAAALCIARRIAKFSETLPSHADVPDGKGAYVAFAVPVRKQQRSFWLYLGDVSRKLRAALAEHFRVAKGQSVEAFAPT